MPSISLAHSFTPTTTPSSSDYRENLHQETPTTQTSFAAVNGRLDDTNLDTGEKPSHDKIREHSFSKPYFVGSTLNVDIFKEVSFLQGGLGDYIDGTRDSAADGDPADGFTQAEILKAIQEQSQVVLAIAWYNPYTVQQVNLSWGLALSVQNGAFFAYNADGTTGTYTRYTFNDPAYFGEVEADSGLISGFPPTGGYTNTFTGAFGTNASTGSFYAAPLAAPLVGTKATLFVDDTPYAKMQRNFGDGYNAYADEGPVDGTFTATDAELYEDHALRVCSIQDMRFWSGTLTLDANTVSGGLTKGWHTASIRILTDRRVVRIHCRRMLAHAIR